MSEEQIRLVLAIIVFTTGPVWIPAIIYLSVKAAFAAYFRAKHRFSESLVLPKENGKHGIDS
jgi:hypothetical protein